MEFLTLCGGGPLINGSSYDIKEGKTKIDGTDRTIKFESKIEAITPGSINIANTGRYTISYMPPLQAPTIIERQGYDIVDGYVAILPSAQMQQSGGGAMFQSYFVFLGPISTLKFPKLSITGCYKGIYSPAHFAIGTGTLVSLPYGLPNVSSWGDCQFTSVDKTYILTCPSDNLSESTYIGLTYMEQGFHNSNRVLIKNLTFFS